MNVNFLWKRPILSMNYFECVFQEFWPQIKEQILYRTYFEQNYHWLLVQFVFPRSLYIFVYILHASIQSLKESRVVAVESFSTELKKAILHTCSKKRCFLGRRYKKTPTPKYKFRWQGFKLVDMLVDIRPKNCERKTCISRPGRHMYLFCMFISRLFSSVMKWGV